MGFSRTEADKLLAECHRRCCICHRFCGVKMELHHIEPTAQGGTDEISNAIPVCFECHAEIQLYNDAHPRGRKFHPAELLIHKAQWLQVCTSSTGLLLSPMGAQDVGPIQALVDELGFDKDIARRVEAEEMGAKFLVSQFQRAIEQGLFALLPDDVRTMVSDVYVTMMRANAHLGKMASMPWGGTGSAWHHAYLNANRDIKLVYGLADSAQVALLDHLGHERTEA